MMNITLPPELKRFVEAKAAGGRYADAGEVVRDALRLMAARDKLEAVWSPIGQPGQGEASIEFLISHAMRMLAADNEEDLKQMLAHLKALNAAKKALRDLIQRMRRDRLANELRREYAERLDCTRGMGSERAYHRVRLPVLDPDAAGGLRWVPTDLAGEKLTRVEQLDCIVDELQSKLDGLSDLSDLDAMKLQMLMERRSKFMEMLSNVMKKISETQAALVGNLK
jgi:putative addiction module CopG family antidote